MTYPISNFPNTSGFLDTSSSNQTKEGPLTIQSTFTVGVCGIHFADNTSMQTAGGTSSASVGLDAIFLLMGA